MSLSDKYLAKAWPAVTKLVTLGLVVRKSQILEGLYNDNRTNRYVYMNVPDIRR